MREALRKRRAGLAGKNFHCGMVRKESTLTTHKDSRVAQNLGWVFGVTMTPRWSATHSECTFISYGKKYTTRPLPDTIIRSQLLTMQRSQQGCQNQPRPTS